MQAPTHLGPYDVIGTLGEGGMGAVYRGRHRELGIERAVKVLLGNHWDPQRFARFEREVTTLAALRHPNLIAVRELGLEGGRPWFAMDLVEGKPLDAVMAERPPLDRALAIAADAARGVAALHAAGIVHRDLKPANIMLAKNGRAVVLDLGLAVAPERDQRLTQTGAMLGTLGYMAPEQLYGAKQAVPQTDVYALALILFELVTGVSSLPSASSQPELVGKILNEGRALPSSADSSLPAAVDGIFARATAREPERRYLDAGELAEAIEAARERPGLSRRTRRGLWAALVAVLLAPAPFVIPFVTPPAPQGRAAAVTRDPTPALAARERARLGRIRTARARIQRARAWLAAYGDDERIEGIASVRSQLRADLREAPLLVFEHPGETRGWLLGGDRAVSLGSDGTVRAWSLRDGAELARWDCEGKPRALAVMPDAESFVVYRRPHELHWLTIGSAEPMRVVAHPWEEPYSLAINPEGDVLAAGGHSNYVHMIDVDRGEQHRDYGAHMGDVLGVGYSGGGTRLLTVAAVTADSRGTFDNQIRAYDLTATTKPMCLSAPLAEAPLCLAAASDQRTFFVGTDRGAILRCDLRARRVSGELRRDGHLPHGGPVQALATADGGRLVSVGERELLLWDTEEETLLRRIDLSAEPCSVDLSPDGKRALVGNTAGRLELWVLE